MPVHAVALKSKLAVSVSHTSVCILGIMAASSMKNSARRSVSNPSQEEAEEDRISCLPRELIERILSHLSLREAVRTSILSRRWRYTWTTLRQLVFDTNCSAFPPECESITDRMVKIIDNVLKLHCGPIEKFKVLFDENPGINDIDRWILYLSNSRISLTDLTLIFEYPVEHCKIPLCLFHCCDLVKLELHNCSLILPHEFQGFKNLERLTLYHVESSQDSLEKLISGCPRLSELTLTLTNDVTCLNIDAPSLQCFKVEGYLEGISFGHNSLTRVGISMLAWLKNGHAQFGEYSSNLQKFFAHLTHISDLRITGSSLEYLSAGEVPAMLPNRILDLEYLRIGIDLLCLQDILTTLCLLRSSPHLKEIVFVPFFGRESDPMHITEDFCSEVFSSPCPLEALRSVRAFCVKGSPLGKGFLKFLLSNSPVLERMEVCVFCPVFEVGADGLLEEVQQSQNAAGEFLEELEQTQRASDQAELIVWCDDS